MLFFEMSGRVKMNESQGEHAGRSREPKLACEAWQGLAGRIIKKIDPYTEADPAGVLVQLLACFGSVIGRQAHFRVGDGRHSASLFAVIVGQSAKARKGSGWTSVEALFAKVAPDWLDRVASGLSSGEGVIEALRDPSTDSRGNDVAGVTDKRLMVFEGEFAQTLRVLRREGNTLSAVVRNLWDGKTLGTLTRNPLKASEPHGAIAAHITSDELKSEITKGSEMFNGFANRFLWVFVRRSKMLSNPQPYPEGYWLIEIAELGNAIAFAQACNEVRRDSDSQALWDELYHGELSRDPGGLLGGATNRGDAQIIRLSMLYALLDCSNIIRSEHLRAALAVWRYCGHSAEFIFGNRTGDDVADKILGALECAPKGLSKTEISAGVFGRNKGAAAITSALHRLESGGHARMVVEDDTGGRSAERWFWCSPFAEEAVGTN